MDFKNGFNIKPEKILRTGKVVFTNGTDKVLPNQIACEAYGYTYNAATGSCDAYKYSSVFNKKFGNILNNISGGKTETGTVNTILNGQQNATKGDNFNNIITQYLPLTYIEKVANCVIGFEANVIGINYGGEGEIGQYIYLQLKGAVVFTNGLASTYTQTSTTIAAGGLTATATMKDVTATSFGVNVTGVTEIRIQWTASIKLWQNKLTTTF